jgi:hypothetical protein
MGNRRRAIRKRGATHLARLRCRPHCAYHRAWSKSAILQTLKQICRQHAIVVEAEPTGREFVRGIFSATTIGRRLGVPIQTFEVANTFAEIEAALAIST